MANNCKVIIVDDDKGVRASLAALLRTAVFEVETYGSGPEFLQAWTPERCGCVLIDVRMPGMSGLQLQTQLAEQGITPGYRNHRPCRCANGCRRNAGWRC